MASPTINFIWIGDPKFNQGGQDVVSPESFDRNFKTWKPTNPNPMVFWCQDHHCESYRAYFKSKNIHITVQSIEHYLKTSPLEQKYTEFLLQEYQTLILDPSRNKIVDRVFFKDMFFNYLLASQGNYVLDTNIHANIEFPIVLPAYSTFMFPYIEQKNKGKEGSQITNSIAEVWMQYAPPDNLVRAKQCLAKYMMSYHEAKKLVDGAFYSTMYHHLVGRVAVSAVHLRNNLMDSPNITLTDYSHNEICGVWKAIEDDCDATINDLHLSKEYCNTHYMNRDKVYSIPHVHVYNGKVDRLLFDLAHGTDPNSKSHSFNDYQPLRYDVKNDTTLHIAMRHFNINPNAELAEILLKHGANPNEICLYKDEESTQWREETPLSLCITERHHQGVHLLFKLSQHPIDVDKVLNGKSLLFLAIENGTGFEQLLAHGANPNQLWEEQTHTPLTLAITQGEVETVRLLLNASHPADINRPYICRHHKWRMTSEPPLHLALRYCHPKIVALLLDKDASLLTPTIIQGGFTSLVSTIKIDVQKIKTSPECQQLIEDALLKQRLSSHDVSNSNLKY